MSTTTRTTQRKTVSLESDVCEAATLAAEAENRTLSNYVNTLLKDRFNIGQPTARKHRGGNMRKGALV